MTTLMFRLPDVLAVARHTLSAPVDTLRPDYVQAETGEDVVPALWWVKDLGTYLTGNSTHPGAPRPAYAIGYGPAEEDPSTLLGGDCRVIDVIPLRTTGGDRNLYVALLKSLMEGHNTVVLTWRDSVAELRTKYVPPANGEPFAVLGYTRRILDAARAKGLHATWTTGKRIDVVDLAAPGPHGARGRLEVGARSGRVLRGSVTYLTENGVVQPTAEGADAALELMKDLPGPMCTQDCTAPGALLRLVRQRPHCLRGPVAQSGQGATQAVPCPSTPGGEQPPDRPEPKEPRTMSTATFTRDQVLTAVSEGFELAADEAELDVSDDEFTWPRVATLAYLTAPSAVWADVACQHAAYQESDEEGEASPFLVEDGRTFTRDEVSAAVNRAVDDAAEHTRGRMADDIDCLAVNAVLTLLDTPEASFDDVASECYGEDPEEIRKWLADAQ
ncbi:hypothetical protein [Streptomyces sp. NPDC058657]|uniref:hypothetical protein n=1 Tax=unclassified Streptomyces TaxID=2593676 RepID=UPI003663B031